MGFICTTGFELQEPSGLWPNGPYSDQDRIDGVQPDTGTGTGNWLVETTIKRSGAASRAFPDGYMTFTMWSFTTADVALNTNVIASGWFYPTSSFTNTRDIMAFGVAADGVMSVKAQWKGSTQQIGLFYGGSFGTGTQVGSYSAVLGLNAWHQIELRALVDTGSVDTCSLYVDGILVGSGTGLAINEAAFDIFCVGVIGVTGTAGAAVCYWDDITANTYGISLGQQKIAYLPVASDVRVGKWLAGGGGSTNLKNALNNVPPAGLNDASKTNTSQICSDALDSNADGPTETYQGRLRTYRTAGIPGGHMITAVQAAACTGENVAAGTKQFSIQLLSNPTAASALTAESGYDAGACGTYPTNWGWDRDSGTVPTSPLNVDTGAVIELASVTATNAKTSVCSLVGIVYYDDNEVTYQHARTTRRTHRSPRLRR